MSIISGYGHAWELSINRPEPMFSDDPHHQFIKHLLGPERIDCTLRANGNEIKLVGGYATDVTLGTVPLDVIERAERERNLVYLGGADPGIRIEAFHIPFGPAVRALTRLIGGNRFS